LTALLLLDDRINTVDRGRLAPLLELLLRRLGASGSNTAGATTTLLGGVGAGVLGRSDCKSTSFGSMAAMLEDRRTAAPRGLLDTSDGVETCNAGVEFGSGEVGGESGVADLLWLLLLLSRFLREKRCNTDDIRFCLFFQSKNMVNDVKLFTRRLLHACNNIDFWIMNQMAVEAINEHVSASTFALVLRAGVDLTSNQLLVMAAEAFETCYMFELIRMGVSPNAFLPHTRARSGTALLARGADPSLVLFSLCNPDLRFSEVDLSAVTASLKAGADANAVDRNGRSALHLLVMSSRSGATNAIDMLVNAGANVNATNGSGESVLGAAFRVSNVSPWICRSTTSNRSVHHNRETVRSMGML